MAKKGRRMPTLPHPNNDGNGRAGINKQRWGRDAQKTCTLAPHNGIAKRSSLAFHSLQSSRGDASRNGDERRRVWPFKYLVAKVKHVTDAQNGIGNEEE